MERHEDVDIRGRLESFCIVQGLTFPTVKVPGDSSVS